MKTANLIKPTEGLEGQLCQGPCCAGVVKTCSGGLFDINKIGNPSIRKKECL